jgi:hypothetical protein
MTTPTTERSPESNRFSIPTTKSLPREILRITVHSSEKNYSAEVSYAKAGVIWIVTTLRTIAKLWTDTPESNGNRRNPF